MFSGELGVTTRPRWAPSVVEARLEGVHEGPHRLTRIPGGEKLGSAVMCFDEEG